MTLNGNTANIRFDEFEFVVLLTGDDFQNPASFSQDLRAYAVTGQPRYARFHVLKLNPDLQLSFCDRRAGGILRTPSPVVRALVCSQAPDSVLRVRDAPNVCREQSGCAVHRRVPAT